MLVVIRLHTIIVVSLAVRATCFRPLHRFRTTSKAFTNLSANVRTVYIILVKRRLQGQRTNSTQQLVLVAVFDIVLKRGSNRADQVIIGDDRRNPWRHDAGVRPLHNRNGKGEGHRDLVATTTVAGKTLTADGGSQADGHYVTFS